jgi:hypothetical protein
VRVCFLFFWYCLFSCFGEGKVYMYHTMCAWIFCPLKWMYILPRTDKKLSKKYMYILQSYSAAIFTEDA